jgi:hypothetical protein
MDGASLSGPLGNGSGHAISNCGAICLTRCAPQSQSM